MSGPKLRVPASGFGGSGYKNPWTGERVPGVTTVLGAIDKPAIRQWAVDQTAAYAAVNAERLLDMSEDQAFGFLRFYHSRYKEHEFDNPMIDLTNYHVGVLNDLAELGTLTHDWAEANIKGEFEPELVREEQVDMVEAFLEWKDSVFLSVHDTELTVFGEGYAGTADWFVTIDGVPTLVDVKTGRSVYDSHVAQLAALGACHTAAREVGEGEGTEYRYTRKGEKFRTWWEAGDIPAFSQYAILQIRPGEFDLKGEWQDAFCKLHVIPQEMIDVAYDMFLGALEIRLAQYEYKQLEKRWK